MKTGDNLYYIYMARCGDNSLYTGITTDPVRRFKEHLSKNKKGAKYTATHGIVTFAALWSTDSGRSGASKLESFLKKLSKNEKEGLVKNPSEINTKYGEYFGDIKFDAQNADSYVLN